MARNSAAVRSQNGLAALVVTAFAAAMLLPGLFGASPAMAQESTTVVDSNVAVVEQAVFTQPVVAVPLVEPAAIINSDGGSSPVNIVQAATSTKRTCVYRDSAYLYVPIRVTMDYGNGKQKTVTLDKHLRSVCAEADVFYGNGSNGKGLRLRLDGLYDGKNPVYSGPDGNLSAWVVGKGYGAETVVVGLRS